MTTTSVLDNATDTKALASDMTSYHETAVADIVGMIRAKYEDEGTRNFAIGERAFNHAVWQKAHFPGGYQSGDFDTLMSRIRDDVRMWVPIKASSIQIAHWVRCHVLRELVAAEIGRDGANALSMFEYKAIIGNALHFTVKDLEGSLNPCWLDMVRGVVADRAKENGRVTREDFENRVALTVKRAADAKLAALSPVEAATKQASDKVKADAKAKAKSLTDIATAVDTGIASGAITPEGALAVLENVAKNHGVPLVAASIGFDPASCTVADCETLASAMFAAGKLVEMKALAAKLAKGIAIMEKAAAKATAANAAADLAGLPVAG